MKSRSVRPVQETAPGAFDSTSIQALVMPGEPSADFNETATDWPAPYRLDIRG